MGVIVQCAWCHAIKQSGGYVQVRLPKISEIRLILADGTVQRYLVSHGICDACKRAVLATEKLAVGGEA